MPLSGPITNIEPRQVGYLLYEIARFLGSLGGLWFVVDRYLNRIRIIIRGIRLPTNALHQRSIDFSVENVSPAATSFEPTIDLVALSAVDGRKYHYTLDIIQFVTYLVNEGDESLDLRLLPHVTRSFSTSQPDINLPDISHLCLMTFTFKLSRGRTFRYRALNVDGFKQLGFFRFYWLRLYFRSYGNLP